MAAPLKNNNLPKQILVIDDDSTVGQSLEVPFSSYNIRIFNTQDLETAFRYFEEESFPVVLVEMEFEPMHGLAIIQRWRAHKAAEKRATGFVVMTGKARNSGDDTLLRELSDIESILKPLKPINLLPYISRGMNKHHQLMQFQVFRESVMQQFTATADYSNLAEAVKRKIPEFGTRAIELLIELYELAGAFEQAIAFVNGALSREPTNSLYLTAKGRLLLRMNRPEDARTPLEQAYKAAPIHLDRLAAMEDLYLKLKEPAKALEKMDQRLKFIKGDIDQKFGMANKLQNAGEDELARKFVRSNANPMEVVRYYNNKGVAMAQVGQFKEAIKEYERALSYFPSSKENYRIHYNIALARLKSKSPSDCHAAIGSLKKCLELAPTFDKAKNTLHAVQANTKKAG